MKRRDLIQHLSDEGCVLARHGANHDLYRNVITGKIEAVPRHAEINEFTAKAIIKKLSALKSAE